MKHHALPVYILTDWHEIDPERTGCQLGPGRNLMSVPRSDAGLSRRNRRRHQDPRDVQTILWPQLGHRWGSWGFLGCRFDPLVQRQSRYIYIYICSWGLALHDGKTERLSAHKKTPLFVFFMGFRLGLANAPLRSGRFLQALYRVASPELLPLFIFPLFLGFPLFSTNQAKHVFFCWGPVLPAKFARSHRSLRLPSVWIFVWMVSTQGRGEATKIQPSKPPRKRGGGGKRGFCAKEMVKPDLKKSDQDVPVPKRPVLVGSVRGSVARFWRTGKPRRTEAKKREGR